VSRYRDAQIGGCVEAVVEQRVDGSTLVRSTEALRWFPPRMTDCFEQWAQSSPERMLVARREGGGEWRRVTFAQMLARAQAVGQALLDLGLSAERPLAILSGNDIEHLTLALGALWAGVPYVPVSTAYSRVSQDFGKLRHILGAVAPRLLFASDASYVKAIDATVPGDVTRLISPHEFERLLGAIGARQSRVPRRSTTKASTAPGTRRSGSIPRTRNAACSSTAAQPKTSSSRPAPSSASARCAPRSCWPAPPACRTR